LMSFPDSCSDKVTLKSEVKRSETAPSYGRD
jgi:hypothetical protein